MKVVEQIKSHQARAYNYRFSEEISACAEVIVQKIPQPALVLDTNLLVIAANQAFYKFFRLKFKQTRGHPIYSLASHLLDLPVLRQCLNKVLNGNNGMSGEVDLQMPWGRRVMQLNVRTSRTTDMTRMVILTFDDITQRRIAEEGLLESEEKFRNLAEESPNIITISRNRKLLYINRKGEDTLGYHRQEVCSPNYDFMTLFAPEYRALMMEGHTQHLNNRDIGPIECALLTKDGHRIEALLTTKLIKYASEPAVLAIVTDITERKRAEEALRQSEEKLRTMFKSAAEGIAVIDLSGKILEINDTGLRMHGFSDKNAMRGRSAFDFISPACLDVARTLMRKANEDGRTNPGTIEMDVLRTDGSEFPAEISVGVLKDASGNPSGFIALTRDVTERKCAEEALAKAHDELEARVAQRTAELARTNKELATEIKQRKLAMEALKVAEENFHNSLDSSPLGIRIINANGELLYANQAILNIYGYNDIEELRNTPTRNRYTPKSSAEHKARKRRRGQGEQVNNYEISIVRKDGEVRHLAVFRKEVKWAGKIQFQAVYQDVTERKLAEEKLKALSRRLIDAQEAERRSIARELHDQVIQSLALLKLFMDRAMLSPEEKSKFNWEEARDQVMELITQLRNMSLDLRPKMLDDLGLLPTLIWHFDRYTSQTNIKVNFAHRGLDKKFTPELCTSAYRIIQEVLNNIARHAHIDQVTVRVSTNENTMSIRVEDKGKGFDLAKVPTTSTGLQGMRERVSLLEGKLEIISAVGVGTAVIAELPLAK